jgi:hypothetical protein
MRVDLHSEMPLKNGGDRSLRCLFSPSRGSGKAVGYCSAFSMKAKEVLYTSLLALKSIMGLNLLAFAHSRRSGMDAREQEDQVNNFGRKPIGDSVQEQVGLV